MSEVRTIVGVLAEVRRTDSKGYFCSKCTVMGIDEAEHGLFRSWRVGIYPRVFVKEAAKYQVRMALNEVINESSADDIC